MRNRDDLRWLWQWRYAWHEKSVFVFERESERAKTERQTIPNSSVIGLGALRCDEIFLSKIFLVAFCGKTDGCCGRGTRVLGLGGYKSAFGCPLHVLAMLGNPQNFGGKRTSDSVD